MLKEKRKSFISVRGGFSDSSGVLPCNSEIQFEEFDSKTRVLISNKLFLLLQCFFERCDQNYLGDDQFNASNEFCKSILSDVFGEPISIPSSKAFVWEAVFAQIGNVASYAPYNEVLDIVWYICNWLTSNYSGGSEIVYDRINELFEQEYVGYRFVKGKIVAITDKIEISEIEEASTVPITGCRAQIQKAIEFLADRRRKDYKNSIKESISAVETVCKVITGDKNATLSGAIKILKTNGIRIHPSLETAFLKLYGYTSDEGGIRHGEGQFVSDVTFEEAKFMLVSCCAFINYLVAEYAKTGKSV